MSFPGWGRAGLGALALLLGLACAERPALAGEVPCDGFVLGYEGEVKHRKCTEERNASGMTAVEVKQGYFADHAFFILVVYVKSDWRTYLPMRTLQQLVLDGGLFSRTADWQPKRSVRGFEAAAFKGLVAQDGSLLDCAIFSRYFGNPGNYEFTGGPGYPNHLEGYYCAEPGFLTPAQHGDGFYGLVESAIAKLRLPPTD